ncbi:MAG: hypothetical protein KF847_05695 [Pirellulales bacterium]|nr:hypothetical protein [Pirellulales bacterium]
MAPAISLDVYRDALRVQVCARCPERPPLGPPCEPLGKRCGIELHLEKLVEIVHAARSARIDPYIEGFHENICVSCPNSVTSQCPCPLEYLISLAVDAIEEVDRRERCQS